MTRAIQIAAFGASVAMILAMTLLTPSSDKGEGLLQAKAVMDQRPG